MSLLLQLEQQLRRRETQPTNRQVLAFLSPTYSSRHSTRLESCHLLFRTRRWTYSDVTSVLVLFYVQYVVWLLRAASCELGTGGQRESGLEREARSKCRSIDSQELIWLPCSRLPPKLLLIFSVLSKKRRPSHGHPSCSFGIRANHIRFHSAPSRGSPSSPQSDPRAHFTVDSPVAGLILTTSRREGRSHH